MGLVYVVALIRYRGLIPLLLLLMAAEYAGRMLVATYRGAGNDRDPTRAPSPTT